MGATTDHPLRHAPFRWLVTGTTVNLLGSGIAPVALAFAVLDLGGDATDLGIVVGLYALADVAAVLFGGVLGDRLPRTVMLQGTSAAAAVVQGVVALSLIGGWSSIPLLAGLGMLNGSLSALGSPSSSAITQQTVPGPPAAAGDLVAPDQPEHRAHRRQRRRRPAGGPGGQRLGARLRRAHVRGRRVVLHPGLGAAAGRAAPPARAVARRRRRLPRGACGTPGCGC